MRVAVLMPAFNEREETVASTLEGVRSAAATVGGITVYLADDGSRAPIALSRLPAATPEFEIVLARHIINLGQGAALETARTLALRDERHTRFATMDVDGQHRIEDLPALLAAIDNGADVAFGNRFAAESNVPLVRRVILLLAREFEFVITGLRLKDAHNGYRAFSRKGIDAVRIRQDRMAHATEIKQNIAKARRSLVIAEVPVSIRYTAESMQKGQSSMGAIAIVKDLAQRFLFGPE